jgi:diguanylate cyclase (GGDEF)-like protein
MNQVLSQFETTATFGLYWPAWLAVGGIAVFGLLGLYAGFLFFADPRLIARCRFLLLPTLRGRIMLSIILAATLPAISLALVLMERTTNDQLDHTADLLKSQTVNFARMADYFQNQNIENLKILAADLSIDDPSKAEESLHRYQRKSQAFHSVLLVDTEGLIVAGTEFGATPINALSLDMDYVREPLKSKQAFLSGVESHPGDAATSTAVISIPIQDGDGHVSGLLIGYYNLSKFTRMKLPILTKSDIESILIDKQGKVLYVSNLGGTVVGQNLSGKSLLTDSYSGDKSLFSFEQMASDGSSLLRYLATGSTLRSGWRIYLVRPLKSIEATMLSEYGMAMAWLGGALIISICLALAMVSGISAPLESLDQSVREFDIDKPQKRPNPPAIAPQEVRSIFAHLDELDKRIRSTYSTLNKALTLGEKLRVELIHVLSNREKEIESRTEELKEANATLERLSREDSLTGLANRRWFAQFLAQAWRSALRDHKAISILIMDIDNFKAYNDTYGHQKGDECLKLVAQTIRRAVGRASDLVSRYGGEEFVVVLGDTPLEGALKIAEHIRDAVDSLKIPHKTSKDHQHVTLSIGVTSTLPTHDTQPETVLISADRAMYNAKREGKNRVAYSTAARTGTYQALTVMDNSSKRLS